MRILIIDDETFTIDMLADVMENQGHSVAGITADSGVRSALAQYEPDAIVLDYNMPGNGGVEALKIIKEVRPDLVERTVCYTKYADLELESPYVVLEGIPKERILKKGAIAEDAAVLLRIFRSAMT